MPTDLKMGSQHMTLEYLQLNPKHKEPVLVIDGAPLTEKVPIQIWIARHYPAAKLLPADPVQELPAISPLAWCASGIDPFLSRASATSPARRSRSGGSPNSSCLKLPDRRRQARRSRMVLRPLNAT